MFKVFQKDVPSGSRVIVLDDGAMLISVFNENFDEIDPTIEVLAIEQTSAGFRILEKQVLRFPVINVARSSTKLEKETPYIADACLGAANIYLAEKSIKEKRFLVVGLGKVGKAVMEQLQRSGAEVTGYDIAQANLPLHEHISRVKPNVIIGATGSTSVTKDDIEHISSLGHPVYLISVSSSDREFSTGAFRSKVGSDVHSDITYKTVTFVNGGFPINFAAIRRKEDTMWIIRTICLIMGSILFLASLKTTRKLKPGFVSVPRSISDVL